ncbi:hypothetical protein M569_17221, partial [Genlisea aurea]
SVSSMQTNLESFLNNTTPVVPSQFLSKSETRKINKLWHPVGREKLDYFLLGDLWKTFDERSAYGVGVPILSDDDDDDDGDAHHNVVQYFVPYLSAIQIFTSSSPNAAAATSREESDSARDSFSDSFSDESESEKLSNGCSSEEGPSEQQDHHPFWLPNERLGNLYFQYFERSSPYVRVPLTDKICSFARRYPGLMTLRSVDISPASWLAVAWF